MEYWNDGKSEKRNAGMLTVKRKDYLMMRVLFYTFIFAVIVPVSFCGAAEDDDLLAWWKFDKALNNRAIDYVTGLEDIIEDNFKYTDGVSGSALKFDGFTTAIVREAKNAPHLGDQFTIETWIALGAYPWNLCPIICQNLDSLKGYYFAAGPRGEIVFEIFAGESWQGCKTEDFVVPLRKWLHVAVTLNKSEGIAIYINGRLAGNAPVEGNPVYAVDADVLFGMNPKESKPSFIHREHGTLPSFFSLDGILDELKIYKIALEKEQILAAFEDKQPASAPDLPARIMPSGPKGSGRFGAYYTKLKYYDEWDALWPVAADPDVVVRFDQTDSRVVFWRGTRYSAAWVTGNGLWMCDQSVEAWGVGENDKEGCFEHMQDRFCRQSHVRIIENNAARVVVHWRYAPMSAYENLWRIHPKTGWACWVDEYYYIYPDAMAVRKVSWKKGTLGRPRQFQESLPLTHTGQLQSDVINLDFVTVGNLKGQSEVLSFVKNPREKENLPENLNMQIYNFKSENKPFIIFEPGNKMNYVKDRRLGPNGLDVPGACNHWPVGMARCDGRTVQAADRPTHFLGFPISYPPVHEKGDRMWWNGLYGLTNKSIKDLAVVNRSWVQAPVIVVGSDGFSSQGYDVSQRAYKLRRAFKSRRAYKLTRIGSDSNNELNFKMAASESSPVFNPAFVIENWGEEKAIISIQKKVTPPGKDVRIGFRHRLDRIDLIVWLKYESVNPVDIKISSK